MFKPKHVFAGGISSRSSAVRGVPNPSYAGAGRYPGAERTGGRGGPGGGARAGPAAGLRAARRAGAARAAGAGAVPPAAAGHAAVARAAALAERRAQPRPAAATICCYANWSAILLLFLFSIYEFIADIKINNVAPRCKLKMQLDEY